MSADRTGGTPVSDVGGAAGHLADADFGQVARGTRTNPATAN